MVSHRPGVEPLRELFLSAGVDPAWLVKATFEANCLLLFALCFWHSLKAHGWRRTTREFSAGFTLTALAESTGVLSGAYVYPGFVLYVGATPVANPASWVALVYVIMRVTDRLVFGRAALSRDRADLRLSGGWLKTLLVLASVDAGLALGMDLVLDPLATLFNWWLWVPCEAGVHGVQPGVVDAYNFSREIWMSTPDTAIGGFFAGFFEGGLRYPTRLFGIPLINFVAWFVFVFVYTLQSRWVEGRADWSEGRRTAVLWALVLIDWPVMSFVLITPNL